MKNSHFPAMVGQEVAMQVDTWCAQHNLPQPTDGTVPMETAIYVAVCLSRRNRDLPDEVLVYLVRLSLGYAEA